MFGGRLLRNQRNQMLSNQQMNLSGLYGGISGKLKRQLPTVNPQMNPMSFNPADIARRRSLLGRGLMRNNIARAF